MRILKLVWDEDTIEHVSQHGVHPQEAEEVCRMRPLVLRTRQGRYLVLGQTAAGRYLTVIVTPQGGGQAKLITARIMTDAERQRYHER